MLGITHPVILAGMNMVAHAELVAAVSNAGGLGMLRLFFLTTFHGYMCAFMYLFWCVVFPLLILRTSMTVT